MKNGYVLKHLLLYFASDYDFIDSTAQPFPYRLKALYFNAHAAACYLRKRLSNLVYYT